MTKTLSGTLPEWKYEYDAFGNLKSHEEYDVGGFVEKRTFAINAQKNQLASASYDWRGNLLSWGGGSYGFDEVGNLQSVGSATVHLYSASDERVGTLHSPGAGDPLEETYTLRSAGGQVLRQAARDDSMPAGDLNWKEDYVWRGGQLLATVHPGQNNDFKRHYTLNHLGSPVLVTSWQANTVARYDYAPFGEDMSSSNPPGPAKMPMRFTGHERDFLNPGTLDDLDYMHARHYTPYVGRFLQVDPVLGNPGSPQSWNRYAYVGNDPVNLTDPTGMVVWDCRMQTIWYGTDKDGNITQIDRRMVCEYKWSDPTSAPGRPPKGDPFDPRDPYDPTLPDPTNPDPTRPDPTKPDPIDPIDPGCDGSRVGQVCTPKEKTPADQKMNQVFDALVDMNLSEELFNRFPAAVCAFGASSGVAAAGGVAGYYAAPFLIAEGAGPLGAAAGAGALTAAFANPIQQYISPICASLASMF